MKSVIIAPVCQGFYTVTESNSFEEGGKSCLTLAGLGKLSPNMLLIGFKSNWAEDLERTRQYFNVLEVIIIRKTNWQIFNTVPCLL